MPVEFKKGQILGRGDLDIFLTTYGGVPSNAAEIYYAIYYVDPSSGSEVLIGSSNRNPVNPTVGEYYASLMVPEQAPVGDYRVRWNFKERVTYPFQQVVQEWTVISGNTTESSLASYSENEQAMIHKLRILLRDHAPDRHYHFRPPEHEGDIGQYNKVMGYIWENMELLEFLERGLDWWNMFPPETEDLKDMDKLIQRKPAWRTAVLWCAIIHATFALQANWVADEFSVIGETELELLLPSGKKVILTISELYSLLKGDA